MTARAEWVSASAESFARRYRVISGGVDGCITYVCGVGRRSDPPDALDRVKLSEAFRAELERVAPREQERRITLTGPHRDDLVFTMQGSSGPVDLREYGSGGQVRTAAIALRMVEADTRRERRDRDPLILLDDVFAELDRPRSIRILELLEAEQPGQVILTAPKESDLELRHGQLDHWRIAAGMITQ
jgi:DNA replication and repair protein RecF